MASSTVRRALALAGGTVLGALGAVALRRRRHERATERRVDDLLAAADAAPARTYTSDDLEGLPDPVRGYLDAVLAAGRPYVRTARLRQVGEFRLGGRDAPWKPLTATQHFSVRPPGFVWDASIEVLPFVPARVVDRYTDGEGALHARLLSAVTVASAGPSPGMNEGELARYLAESVWFPTALLPGEGVEWDPIDDRSARATIEHAGNTASLTFHFEDDRVVRVESDGRYRQETDDYAPWTGYFDDYAFRGGMHVPLDAAVEWNLPDGNLRYWRAAIEDVAYDPAR